MNQTAQLPPLEFKPGKAKREARDLELYNEYKNLIGLTMADPNLSKVSIVKRLMAQFDIASTGTVYAIIKRVEERLNTQKQEDEQ